MENIKGTEKQINWAKQIVAEWTAVVDLEHVNNMLRTDMGVSWSAVCESAKADWLAGVEKGLKLGGAEWAINNRTSNMGVFYGKLVAQKYKAAA